MSSCINVACDSGNLTESYFYLSKEVMGDFFPAWINSVILGFEYNPWIFSAIGSVLVGLSGVLPLLVIPLDETDNLKQGASANLLKTLLSFAVGGLLGDIFLHVLPESWANDVAQNGGDIDGHATLNSGFLVLTGLLLFVCAEKLFSVMACLSEQVSKSELENVPVNNNIKGVDEKAARKSKRISGYLNLLANFIDNFTHGLSVGGSFMVSFRLGALSTFAILIHEIPHEVGDFAILLKSGFSRWDAAMGQIATAGGGLVGALVAVACTGATNSVEVKTSWILPFTGGGFLHIALVTVLPDLLKEEDPKESLKQLFALLAGISIMGTVTVYLVIEMYKRDKSVGLVTIASETVQNLALLDADEHLNAETMAVMHDGYINIIPLMNPTRRAKYLSLTTGTERGQGTVKQIKWLKLHRETLFVVLSTIGMQIYDAEVTDLRYYNTCKTARETESCIIGACTVRDKFLVVANTSASIWIFSSNDSNSEFQVESKFCLELNSLTIIGSADNYIIAGNDDQLQVWNMEESCGLANMVNKRYLNICRLLSPPSTLLVINYLVFLGFDSGEFCVFDLLEESFFIRVVAHKLRITMLDFSVLKYLILTVSMDSYVKIWSYSHSSKPICLFSHCNEQGPLCGGAFLNLNCTEFCLVTVESLDVEFYVREDNSVGDGDAEKNKDSEL